MTRASRALFTFALRSRAQGRASTLGLACALVCVACQSEPDAPEQPSDASLRAADANAAASASDSGAMTQSDAQVDAAMAALDAGRDAGMQPREAGLPVDASSGSLEAGGEAGAASCQSPGLCSDFEAEKLGPISGMWSARAPSCSGDGKASIDDSVAHSGQKSLRVQSGGGTCNHVFATPTLDFKALGDAFWVRFYVRFERAFTDAHVTFLAMQDQVSKKALRMGGQNKILMWNRELDDATLPELSPKGISLSAVPGAGSFQCIEFYLAGASGKLETYVDGRRVEGLIIDESGTPDVDGQWLRGGKWTANVTELGFGWESYGGEPMTLWYDDIAISSQRPGC